MNIPRKPDRGPGASGTQRRTGTLRGVLIRLSAAAIVVAALLPAGRIAVASEIINTPISNTALTKAISVWRVALRAASVRCACDAELTSCLADVDTIVDRREK